MRRKPTLWALTVVLIAGIIIGLVFNTKLDLSNPSYAVNFEKAVFRNGNDDIANIETTGRAFAKIAKEITPTVVTITSEKKKTVGGGFDEIFKKFHKNIPERGLGSGVIVRADGYIMTNNHVVSEAEEISVKLSDKRVFSAEVVGLDPLTDIALIKINEKNLPVTKFGNSDDIQVGEWALAVGSPLSLNSTVTAGIISAKGRQINIIEDNYGVENFIQTDAVINPGNSGGALVNIQGELIGINTAIATQTGLYQGYGFAVPVNVARSVMESLIKYGKVVRGYVGVSIKEVDAVLAKAMGLEKTTGVLVESFTENSAAKEAGIKEGDVLLEIDGKELSQTSDLQAYIAQKKPGDVVKLLVYQNGSKILKNVMLKSKEGSTTLPSDESDKEVKIEKQSGEIGNGMGFEVERIANELTSQPNYNFGHGVVVVKSSTHAQDHDVFEGYIVTRVNNKNIGSLDEYLEEVKKLKSGDAVLLHLQSTDGERAPIITAIEVRK